MKFVTPPVKCYFDVGEQWQCNNLMLRKNIHNWSILACPCVTEDTSLTWYATYVRHVKCESRAFKMVFCSFVPQGRLKNKREINSFISIWSLGGPRRGNWKLSLQILVTQEFLRDCFVRNYSFEIILSRALKELKQSEITQSVPNYGSWHNKKFDILKWTILHRSLFD